MTVEKLNPRNTKNYIWLLNFIEENFDWDFYITEQNKRYYITDISSLKKLFKNSTDIYTSEDEIGYSGLILLWKSFGGDKKRYYVKLIAKDREIARNLLTALVWNNNSEIFAKLRKDSPYIDVLKQRGFKFRGGRGVQILLKRKKYKPKPVIQKEEE